MSAIEAAPLPSATVLLLRDGPHGMEVFMVKRHHQIDFASGALVFPGGKLDPADADPALRLLSTGGEGLDDTGLALRVGAIREAFEECGILLARRTGAAEPLGGAAMTAVEQRWRAEIAAGRASMAQMAAAEDLRLALDALVSFAHWITPKGLPKRFDTHFFLAAVPPAQLAAHDGSESVDSLWVRPLDALADAEAGRATIIFPTRMNLAKLGRSKTVAEAVAMAAADPIVTVMPEMLKTAAGRVLRIPIEAGYGVSEVNVEGMPRS